MEWFQVNRLSLNAAKTNYQIYSRSTKPNLDIVLNGMQILNSAQLLLLYNTLILPHLNYCAVIWEITMKLQQRSLCYCKNVLLE